MAVANSKQKVELVEKTTQNEVGSGNHFGSKIGESCKEAVLRKITLSGIEYFVPYAGTTNIQRDFKKF